jgi:hypothetical protein
LYCVGVQVAAEYLDLGTGTTLVQRLNFLPASDGIEARCNSSCEGNRAYVGAIAEKLSPHYVSLIAYRAPGFESKSIGLGSLAPCIETQGSNDIEAIPPRCR